MLNLGTIGLGVDLIGAVWMIGHRFWPSRTIGVWLYPTHHRRMNAYQTLLEEGRIEDGVKGFGDLQELIVPTEIVEAQKSNGQYGLDFTYIEQDGNQVVVHADETGTPSNLNYSNDVRRELSGVDDAMERTFEKMFLYHGVGLLVLGFALQIVSELIV